VGGTLFTWAFLISNMYAVGTDVATKSEWIRRRSSGHPIVATVDAETDADAGADDYLMLQLADRGTPLEASE
jgi:hypothetical protein